MQKYIGGSSIELIVCDITELEVDAIVNPANSFLQLGGGVAGAIRRKGGQSIQTECDKIGEINSGEAVITTAGDLKAKYVIHAVGPRMGEGDEDNKLLNATLNSLDIAVQKNLKSLAFPAISTDIFGYPMERCANVMLTTVAGYLKNNQVSLRVVFCLYNSDAYEIFRGVFESF
ncbi:macro domain-containing protein [bacterium]|nr:macro domain-containing protein [bacterium]